MHRGQVTEAQARHTGLEPSRCHGGSYRMVAGRPARSLFRRRAEPGVECTLRRATLEMVPVIARERGETAKAQSRCTSSMRGITLGAG